MADMTDSLIANMAVLEQLLVNLTHLVSNGYENPAEVREEVVEDIRTRMEAQQRRQDREGQRLAALALDHLDRLAPRILGQFGRPMVRGSGAAGELDDGHSAASLLSSSAIQDIIR